MKLLVKSIILGFLFFTFGCAEQSSNENVRKTEDFNFDWRFSLNTDEEEPFKVEINDSNWSKVRLPHDWSIGTSFTQENTGASTAYLQGGIGWYRKEFKIPAADSLKIINVEFDGVYSKSEVWINEYYLGMRPYGYSSFAYDLSPYLKFGKESNIITVKADRTAFIDSRWYPGSGIYRNVRLVTKSKAHIDQWGLKITGSEIFKDKATIKLISNFSNFTGKEQSYEVKYDIFSPKGEKIISEVAEITIDKNFEQTIELSVNDRQLWSIDSPNLYKAKVTLISDNQSIDEEEVTFGIRSFEFDSNKGFFLNGENIKLKGVNLHHDAGLVGTAVPIGVWKRRLEGLKSIGTNAIRTAHNPVTPEFLDLCDQMGFVVIEEAFDEWDRPKGKNKTFLGANDASEEESKGYSSDYFNDWAKRDLQDMIHRDYNHPSIIMWSLGNEIEWTFPYYSSAYEEVNGKVEYYKHHPDFDKKKIQNALKKVMPSEVDTLTLIAKRLSKWAKEIDTTRPITSGNVHPSIAMASGYNEATDVHGFNYRANEYDGAHAEYPELKIYGSENWGSLEEWKAVADKDFVAGIFVWTGIAYLGEADAFPNKGLNLSFFDFAGFKMPRAHFFECLWVDEPKVYLATIPLVEAEWKYDEQTKEFTQNLNTNYRWEPFRLWLWENVTESWNYKDDQSILAEAYFNSEEVELFLNDKSLGVQKLAETPDRIAKWVLPFSKGKLRVEGRNAGEKVADYEINSSGQPAKIDVKTDKKQIDANGYDVAHVEVQIVDENGNPILNQDQEIKFEITGADGSYKILGVDNGWKDSVQDYQSNSVTTHQGRALLILQSGKVSDKIKVIVKGKDISSEEFEIDVR